MSQNFGEKDDVPPSWWALSFTPDPEYNEQVTRLLFAAGCSGVWEREKNDGQLETVAYFPFDRQEELTVLCRRLIPFLLDHGAVEVEKIDQQNWMEGWKEHFRPVKLTPSWLVMPPWWPVAGQAPERIIIHPGMAFGTGTHETTRLAARLLENNLQPGASVLDVGTGSAVLAILAHKLGAGHIFALDIDEDALENAAENCRLNNCEQAVRLSSMPLAVFEKTCDLVVANIIAPVLVKLALQLVARLNPGGCLILSGILLEQLEKVEKIYVDLGCTVEQVLADDEWVAMQCRR
jgi:ribosomal protein L11 methyltransferase